MVVSTNNFPVKDLYYYVIDFRRLMDPVLMPIYFPNSRAAKRVINANYPNRNTSRMFSVMSGKKLKKRVLNYRIGSGNYLRKGGKYPYPGHKMSVQEKKSFRTLLRRRLRRMGLYTTNKAKYEYSEGTAKKIKAIKNFQKVAKNKNSDAKVFRLDRKPRHFYYIILKKCQTAKRGKLFKIRTLQVNTKTGKYLKVTIYTNRNDIFFPDLLENLKKMKNGANAVRAYKRYKTKQEAILQKTMEELFKNKPIELP